MKELSWRAMEFVLDAAVQNTNSAEANEEALFIVGLIMEGEQKRQLDAAQIEVIKILISDYEAALPSLATSH